MRTTVTLGLSAALLLACSDDPKPRRGESCTEDSECTLGLCYANECLDPEADDDGDGLINKFEVTIGSNPKSADTDGDGIRDADELSRFGEVVDSDGDGIPNILESAIIDTDKDCISDELDFQNTVPNNQSAICTQREYAMLHSSFTVHHHPTLGQIALGQSSGLDAVITETKANVPRECSATVRHSLSGERLAHVEAYCATYPEADVSNIQTNLGQLTLSGANDSYDDGEYRSTFTSTEMVLKAPNAQRIQPYYAGLLYGGRLQTAETAPISNPSDVTNEYGGGLYVFMAEQGLSAEVLGGKWGYVSLQTELSSTSMLSQLDVNSHVLQYTSSTFTPTSSTNIVRLSHASSANGLMFEGSNNSYERNSDELMQVSPGRLSSSDGSANAIFDDKFIFLVSQTPGLDQLANNEDGISQPADYVRHEIAFYVRHANVTAEQLAAMRYEITRQEIIYTEDGIGIGLTTGILHFDAERSGVATYTDQGRISLVSYSGRFTDETYPTETRELSYTINNDGMITLEDGEGTTIQAWAQAGGYQMVLGFQVIDGTLENPEAASLGVALGHCTNCLQ